MKGGREIRRKTQSMAATDPNLLTFPWDQIQYKKRLRWFMYIVRFGRTLLPCTTTITVGLEVA